MVQSEEPERNPTSRESTTDVAPEPSSFDLRGATQLAAAPTWDHPASDGLVWDNMPDIDIFQHFDPNFNLDAVDAALADDTQPLFPITFGNLTF